VRIAQHRCPTTTQHGDYGEAIIRSLLRSDLDAHESRLMVIAQGSRVIASIAFNLAALRNPRTLQ